jgi:putative phage-type endonuclease
MTDELYTSIQRQRGIGASEVAAVLGIDPFSQPFNVWESKVCSPEEFKERFNFDRPEDPEALSEIGRAIEPLIAQLYEKRTSHKLSESPTVTHPAYPWLFASPDRLTDDPDKGLEIKNVNPRMAVWWGADGTDEIAEYYMPQVQTCMLLTGRKHWDVAALIGGSELRVFHIKADPEFHELILEITKRFWEDYVSNKTPPPIDYNHRTASESIQKKYGKIISNEVSLDDRIAYYATVYQDLGKQISEMETARKVAMNQIADAMGKDAIGILDDGREIIRKEVTRKGYTTQDSTYIHTTIRKRRKQ